MRFPAFTARLYTAILPILYAGKSLLNEEQERSTMWESARARTARLSDEKRRRRQNLTAADEDTPRPNEILCDIAMALASFLAIALLVQFLAIWLGAG